MLVFSAGSINLINDLRSGQKQTLQNELDSFLLSLKEDLKKKPWWQNGWVFMESQDGASSDTYISKHDWAVDDDNYKIWIGIGGFTPENLFMDSPENANLYVWASNNKYRSEAQKMGAQLLVKDKNKYGEINLNVTRGFVIDYSVPKYLSGQIPQFDEIMRKQIIDFIDYFASVL